MKTKNSIKNSVSRIWNKKELNKTIKQARKLSFEVWEGNFLIDIINPSNKETILTAAIISKNNFAVRYDSKYFDCLKSDKPIHIYPDGIAKYIPVRI